MAGPKQRELTDEEIFGTPAKPGEMSDADVFQAAAQSPQQPGSATIPIGIPGGRGQQYARRVGSDFMGSGQMAGQGVADIVEHPFGSLKEGNVLTGVPRALMGGAGMLFSPVTAALAPATDPVLQPVGGAVDKYISKPIEQATGYPSDVTTPAVIQLATLGAIKGGSRLVRGRPAPKPVPRQAPEPVQTNAEIRASANKDYQAADDAGIIVKPEAVQAMKQKLETELADFGYHEKLQPGTAVVLGELDKAAQGGNITLKGLDQIRKITQNAANVTNRADMKTTGKVVKHIDDMIRGLKPEDVLAGDLEAGVAALERARGSWSRLRKSELIDEALNKAKRQAEKGGSGGNLDNAIRQQIDSLLNKPTKLRGFTDAEIAAMKKIVGGRGKVHQLLRLVGKLSPQGNGLMFGLGGYAAMTNPLYAIPAAAGLIAKPISTALTRGGGATLSEMVRRGGPAPATPPRPIGRGLVPPLIGLGSRPPERVY